MNEIIKLWNKNFKKGFSIFQFVLIGIMVVGIFFKDSFLILFSMVVCLLGYFEPVEYRFSLNLKEKKI